MSLIERLNYELPDELIAQNPPTKRTDARMMVLDRKAGSIEHHHIRDLPQFLRSGDALVTNESRVLPARMFGVRETTNGRVEILFLESDEHGIWRVLVKARGRLQENESLMIHDRTARDAFSLRLLKRDESGGWLAVPVTDEELVPLLERVGRIPLPPYIRGGMEGEHDRERYQTVFAKTPGSAAAPTAGLHFTPELLKTLADAGIPRYGVTLHVGLDTFKPMNVDDPAQHVMHSERGSISDKTAAKLRAVRMAGGRIVAVGTTSVRVLETAAAENAGGLYGWSGPTKLFIHPPYEFRAVDTLLTNFHLPRTTLLLLVAAFAGEELVCEAYRLAVREEYRFFSYGDAMLIV
ncbi:MAG: tRNA preQ1(34) S-adenosylmethionine ribosyltransferase-isomerase QueA [Pirellulales bacterium]